MGKFTGVLLASDFDNTLIYTEAALKNGEPTPPLSEKNLAALKYFMAEGGRFAVSTGRALPAFINYADQIPMNAPCVVCNGAVLYDFEKNEYLETALLDGDVRTRGQMILDQFPQVAVEAYHISNVIYAVQPNETTRRHERLMRIHVEEKPSLREVPLPLGKLLFESDHATLEAVRTVLEEQGWCQNYELIFSGRRLLEMTAKNASKGNMIRCLAERLGISMDHVYCIGDEANDLSMLKAAAVGFAPANCIPAVRDSGAVIVADCQHDAVAEVVDILDKKYT